MVQKQPKTRLSNNQKLRKNGFTEGYKLFNLQQEQILDLRIYWGSVNCYAVLWVSHKGIYLSGSGVAGGHGYHKQSAAVSEAINNCGIELSERMAGAGDGKIREAIEEIGKAFGYRKLHIVRIHE